eukprot:TRINITY_DN3441_c1_g1_i1.p1 TRINITY_DN3441_c1_g1~~TRINITY_DN3441_c1_g1_i1.p1  ORF type:complete len:306 (+),score=67.58 TRINITY_DN3441_c1_g1_i1:68-985(+)
MGQTVSCGSQTSDMRAELTSELSQLRERNKELENERDGLVASLQTTEDLPSLLPEWMWGNGLTPAKAVESLETMLVKERRSRQSQDRLLDELKTAYKVAMAKNKQLVNENQELRDELDAKRSTKSQPVSDVASLPSSECHDWMTTLCLSGDYQRSDDLSQSKPILNTPLLEVATSSYPSQLKETLSPPVVRTPSPKPIPSPKPSPATSTAGMSVENSSSSSSSRKQRTVASTSTRPSVTSPNARIPLSKSKSTISPPTAAKAAPGPKRVRASSHITNSEISKSTLSGRRVVSSRRIIKKTVTSTP